MVFCKKNRHYVSSDVLYNNIIPGAKFYSTRLNNLVIMQKHYGSLHSLTLMRTLALHSSKKLIILKLPDLVILQSVVFMFDYHHNNPSYAFDNFFNSKVHNFNARLEIRASIFLPQI